jgi:hypothetical protein
MKGSGEAIRECGIIKAPNSIKPKMAPEAPTTKALGESPNAGIKMDKLPKIPLKR